jgi:hypothetical protein
MLRRMRRKNTGSHTRGSGGTASTKNAFRSSSLKESEHRRVRHAQTHGTDAPSSAKERSIKPRRGDPLVRAVVPDAPADARWEVLQWNKAMCNWQHFAYATTKERCRIVAAEIRALGGKARFRKLVKGPAPAEDAAQSRVDDQDELRREDSSPRRTKVPPRMNAARGKAKSRPKRVADARSTSEPTSAAYRKAVVRSLLHWIDLAERAELEFHLPHAEIKSLRDRLHGILAPRFARLSRDVLADPLLKWQA